MTSLPCSARPGSPRLEYRRLIRAGVNPTTAETLAIRLYAAAERRAVAETAAYAATQPGLRRRRRPVTCSACGDTVQAKNYARHRTLRHEHTGAQA